MLNENAQKWVAALRSGQYQQGKRLLSPQDEFGQQRFCCLGVACEVYQLHVGDLKVATYEGRHIYNGEVAILPSKVQEWLGLASENGTHYRIDTDGSFTEEVLTELNDAGFSFEYIADRIADEPKGLFTNLL